MDLAAAADAAATFSWYLFYSAAAATEADAIAIADAKETVIADAMTDAVIITAAAT